VFDLGLLFGQQRRLERDVLVGLLQFALLRLQFAGQLLRLRQQAFVRIEASIVFSTMPMLPDSCSRNERCEAVTSVSEASSMTALTCFSNSTGKTMMLRGSALIRPERIWPRPGDTFSITIVWPSAAHCPIRPSPMSSVWPAPASDASA
jgi:hypothetical protein